MTHKQLVTNLVKPGKEIVRSLGADTADLWHGATGVCTEAGELLDAVKKVVVYGRPVDVDNVIEELGDLRFYMEQVRQRVSAIAGREVTDEEILDANVRKLMKRYGGAYTDAAAVARADKVD